MGKVIDCNLNSVLTSHWEYDISFRDLRKWGYRQGGYPSRVFQAEETPSTETGDESIASIFKKEQGDQCSWGE